MTKNLSKDDNIHHSSREVLEKQSQIFLNGIEDRCNHTIQHIDLEYHQKDLLYSCINFINAIFLDGFPSYIQILFRIGFFSSNETQLALQSSINYLIIGSYRSAYDHLKRALEMMVLTVYFGSEELSSEEERKARIWLYSKHNTPYFSPCLKKICNFEKFKQFNNKFQWQTKLITLYGEICNFTHIKGLNKGYLELGYSESTAGIYTPSFSTKAINDFCDIYLRVVQEICTMLALHNPILLIEVPLEKFGYNPPISGFFQGKQPDMLKVLIPRSYYDFFHNLLKNDPGILSQQEWFNSLPDMTEEQLEKQALELGLYDYDR